MKKLRIFLFVTALACIFVGCRKPVEVSFSPETLRFASIGDTLNVDLKSNGDWKIDNSPEWLNVSPSSGNGNATLTLMAQPNDMAGIRSGEVKASTKDGSAILKVDQDFVAISLSPNAIECGEEGGEYEVTVSAQIAWTVSGMPDWITSTVTQGNGDATVTLSIAALSGDRREADLVFGNEVVSARLHVIQNDVPLHHISVAPRSLNMVCTGESKMAAIACDESWMAMPSEDWVSLDKTIGSGDDEVLVTVGENPVYVTRRAIVKFVSTSGLVAELFVNQEATPDPHYLEITPQNLHFGKEGGTQQVNVSCDDVWKCDVSCDWVSLSPLQGSGEGTVEVTVEPNSLNEAREVTAIVMSGERTRELKITQDPGDEPLVANFEPDTLFMTYSGGIRNVSVTSNVNWTLRFPSWIMSLSTTSGDGDASFDIIIDVNSAEEQRVGYLEAVHDGEVIGALVVVQEGKANILETDITEIEARPEGGEYVVHVTANQGWSVSPGVDWITASPIDGFGNGTVTLTVAPLAGSQPRTAQVKIGGLIEKFVLITIVQN